MVMLRNNENISRIRNVLIENVKLVVIKKLPPIESSLYI